MIAIYLRTAALGVLAFQLGACTESPTDPSFDLAARDASEAPAAAGLLASEVAPFSQPDFFLDVFNLDTDPSLEPIVILINSNPVEGSFSARMRSGPGTQRGHIRVEWGSRSENDGGTVAIELVQLDLVSVEPIFIEFSGVGTFTDRATGRVVEFDVTGTAQQSAVDDDRVKFRGFGFIEVEAELPARFRILG